MNVEEKRAQWELYGRAWSPVSDAERQQLLKDTLSHDFYYIDPRIDCHGHADVIANLFQAFQQCQPGGSFALRSIIAYTTWRWCSGN